MRLSAPVDRQPTAQTRGGPDRWALLRVLGRLAEGLVSSALAIMLAGMTLMITYDVVMRYGFNRPTRWADEAAMYLMVWIGLLSAAFGVRERTHIRLEILVSRLPATWQRWLKLFSDLGVAAFGVSVAIYGWRLSQLAWNQTTPALGLRTGAMYLVLPATGIIMAIGSLQNLFEHRGRQEPPGEARR